MTELSVDTRSGLHSLLVSMKEEEGKDDEFADAYIDRIGMYTKFSL